jgi:serpin B
MKNKSLLAIFISCIIVIGGIFSIIYFTKPESNINISTQIPLADDSNATAKSVSLLVDSLNDFSFNFYKQISSKEDGNVFFSPYGIFVAFSMAYEGARGNTAIEMQNVLNILQNDSSTLGSFGRIYNLLNQKQEGYTISTANAFWAHQNYEFLTEYLSLLQNFYMAEANELDFGNNIEAAEIINNWIEDKTNDKIKDMIDASMLSDFTKMVLTNAIYFKGDWANPFDPDNTFETDFTLASDEPVKVDMMEIADSDFNYTETEDLQILELQYFGNDLSMIIVLPKENIISIAESKINAENLSAWRDNLIQGDIIVQIPKFKFEKKYSLNKIMKEMGIIDAFEPDIADFSGMDGTKWLFISEAIHQSFIEVNEEGTEAAAATAIVMEATYIPEYKEFIADHPFLFLIQHKETDAILFMGKAMNPAEK